ncbi:MAG: FeS-binding protein [Dehalococcoidia bacterium]|nr:FeS-binding protein [Dehalococcoidia bacterium]
MAPDEIAGLICSKLEERGYRGAVLPIEHVAQLKSEIEDGISQGKIAAGVYDRYLAGFQFDVTTRFPGARSIIMTAAPQPQRKVTFRFNGRMYSAIIPPTYYNNTDKQIRNILQTILTFNDYQLYQAALPLKLLAARSGITKYGKNNIAYIEGLGSFVRLRAFLSDMPAASSEWSEPRAMKECDKCKACLNECPTGAIVGDRFLVHAERCITFLNEESEEFPEWIEPAWHNSLVGCMRCQLVCPVNKPFVKWVEEGENFTEAETELILNGVPLDRLPPGTAHKLNRCYMMEYLDVLPRNLRALMK